MKSAPWPAEARAGRLPPAPAPGWSGWAVLQVAVTAALLGLLLRVFGAEPFLHALRSVDLTGALLAVVLVTVSVLAQADRWRRIAGGYAAAPGPVDAARLTSQATFLNMVLPGGVAGDLVRVLRHPAGSRGRVRTGVAVVAAERLLGTAVTVLGATVALAAGSGIGGFVVVGALTGVGLLALSWPVLRQCPLGTLLRALASSLLIWSALVILFVYAARSAVPDLGTAPAIALGAIALAAMSIPVNVGGWGPRESVTALAAMVWGVSGRDGVSAAATYGVLALIGSLPGAALLAVELARRPPGAGPLTRRVSRSRPR